jgi:osmotically inducible protein OsmC
MPLARREAEMVWEGSLARGTGTLTTGSGALVKLAATWASRTERADGMTSPEELLASAHASCFAMALALVLGENKTPPESVSVSAACTLDEVEGAPRITTVDLTIRAQVPGVEATALRGNVKINVGSEIVSSQANPGTTPAPPGESRVHPRSTSPWPHSRHEAEVEDIVRTLRTYGVLTRARLLEICGAAHWSDSGGRRALARAVSSGRIKQLGDDLYEIPKPPIR